MKKILSLVLVGLMTASLVLGIGAVAQEKYDVSAKCFAITMVASIALPVKKQLNALGFLNKAYFSASDVPFTRAELELVQYLQSKGKAQTQDFANSGGLKLETYARAFRFVVPNAFSGRLELLNASRTFIQGAIPEEFNLGQLPDGYNIAVTHIRVGFVADATITTGQAGVAYGSQPNSWPAALRNGQLIFSQAGAIKGFVDNAFTGTMAASTGRITEDDGLELQAPFILEENKATKIELYTAASQAFASPAGGNLLEIMLYGAMVRLRA